MTLIPAIGGSDRDVGGVESRNACTAGYGGGLQGGVAESEQDPAFGSAIRAVAARAHPDVRPAAAGVAPSPR
ncbi:hypothetical protein [Streptomyces sp. NPDC002082]|uniref:hypothetical protein n=1 Tax=Streptomyces sp. NPDC002082 TaxID=3154772 RepID=UPI00332E4CE0